MVHFLNEEKLGIELPDFFKKPKRAHLQFFILMIIQENPTHGYEIIKKIEKRTFGQWRPSHSAIYNSLNIMTEKSFIEVDKSGERDKKIYKITEKGEKLAEVFRQEANKFFRSFADTLLADEEFEVPLPVIRLALDVKGKSFLEGYTKEKQKIILSKFQQTLKSLVQEVQKKLDSIK